MNVRAEHLRSARKPRTRIRLLPSTTLGWWAIGLAVAFFPLVLAARVIPRGAAFGFISAFVGGVVALVGIIRGKERAVTVFLALVPLVIAITFVLAELVGGTA